MSDLRVRGLGRELGPEAEAAHLRERLRAGELAEPRLRLAAELGSLAAQQALSWAPSSAPFAWVEALRACGLEALIRALIACARDEGGGVGPALPHGFAAEAWVLCPCPRHKEQCEDLPYRPGEGPRLHATLACSAAVVTGTEAAAHRLLLDLAQRAAGARGTLHRARDRSTPLIGNLRPDLVPWLLGAGDPIRTRHLREHLARQSPAHLQRRASLALEAGARVEAGRCLTHLVWYRVWNPLTRHLRGLVDRARQAVALLRNAPPDDFLGLALAAEGHAQRLEFDQPAAQDLWTEAANLIETTPLPPLLARAMECREVLAQSLHEAGRRDEAEHSLRRAITLSQRTQQAGALTSRVLLASWALADGDWDRSRDLAHTHISYCRSYRFDRSARVGEAQLLDVLGDALCGSGQAASARSAYTDALILAEAIEEEHALATRLRAKLDSASA